MKKYFFLATVVAFMLSACSNNSETEMVGPNEPKELIPLTIGTIYENVYGDAVTRSPSIGLQGAKATNPIGLYILKGTTTTTQSGAANYEHFNLSSSSLNDDNPAAGYVGITTSSTLYYPDIKTQGISIYAYSPYNASAPDNTKDISSNLYTIATATDQKYDAGYLSSDFLWGRQGEVVNSTNNIVSAEKWLAAKTAAASLGSASGVLTGTNAAYFGVKATPSATVYVPMKHLCSKVIVKVQVDGNGMDITRLKGATVKFYTDKQSAGLKLSDGSLNSLTGNDHTAIEIGKLGYSADATVIPGSDWDDTVGAKGVIGTDTDGDGNYEDEEITAYTCSGVILPQTVNASSVSLIEIQLAGNSTTYAWSPQASVTFNAEKKYEYTITVKATGLSITTSVTDWTVETGVGAYTGDTGDAQLQ